MSEINKPTLRHRNIEINQSVGSITLLNTDNNLKQRLIPNPESASGGEGRRIGNYDEAPEHNKYLIFILSGYRIGYTTFKDCFKSIFMIHNETVNVWTHFLAVLSYLTLAIYIWYFMPSIEQLKTFDEKDSYVVYLHKYMVEDILGYKVQHFVRTSLPVYPIVLHWLAGALWTLFSTMHHLFMCQSKGIFEFFYKWDSFGALFIGLGINFTINFYIFFWERIFYTSYIALANFYALIIAVMTFHPFFNHTKYRKVRVWLYIFFGLFSSIGVLHSLTGFVPTSCSFDAGALWWWGDWILLFGAYIYVKKIPERYYPKTFDLLGQSHNIWHVLTNVSGVVHILASFSLYYGRVSKNWA